MQIVWSGERIDGKNAAYICKGDIEVAPKLKLSPLQLSSMTLLKRVEIIERVKKCNMIIDADKGSAAMLMGSSYTLNGK